MTAVIQARCPQCGKLLRIPADWLNQAMRCKHCSQVIQAKAVPSGVRASAPPPPPDRYLGGRQTSPALPAVRVATPPEIPVPAHYPAPPAAVAVPVTARPPVAAPVAIMAAPPVGALPSDPHFGDLDSPSPGGATTPRRRRKRGSWMPLIVLGVLLIGVVVGGVYAWPKIAAALNGESAVAQNDQTTQDRPKTPPTKNTTPGKQPDPGKPDPGKPDSSKPDPSKPDPGKVTPPSTNDPFPRRALIISVHNYLYANPTQAGPPGPGSRSIANLKRTLTNGLRIPINQILHVSDITEKGKERVPLKPVIEEALTSFLDACRAQDRIMVFFVGHGVEIDNEPYLVPIEGELDVAKTLIPLKTFYSKLEACKARQKVFVVDVARYSPTLGRERPDGGPLGAKFDAALKNPPAGVQVWSACAAEQQSFETDDSPMGLFLDMLVEHLPRDSGSESPPPVKGKKPPPAVQKATDGKIQRPDEPFPLDKLVEAVNKGMEKELKGLKAQQVSRLVGKENDNGVAYDPKEKPAPLPTLPSPPDLTVNKASLQLVKGVLEEVGVPPVKPSAQDNGIQFEMLPPFKNEALEKYVANNAPEDPKLRQAIMKARAALWAVSPNGKEPLAIAGEVKKFKEEMRNTTLSVLKDGYRAPSNEGMFKNAVFEDERKVAVILGGLTEALEELKGAEEEKEKESKRWKANYDFMLARLQAQIAFLYEYQSMLGQMRKELPPRDAALHGGWKLAAQTTLTGDSTGKKLAASSRKLLDKIAKDHAGTPWEVLAKREKLTALGLEWKATR